MERRKAITTAAIASMTLLAGATAFSLNTGILGASGSAGPGRISPTGAASTNAVPVGDVAGAEVPATTGTTSSHSDRDDERGDDRSSDDSHDEDDGRYEGADDDD
jgi:hypothetical protein